jgi:predicted ester cyclase
MSAEKYQMMIQEGFEALNRADLEAFAKAYDDNCVYHGTPPWPDTIGVSKQKQYLAALFNAYPDAKFAIDEILVSGNSIATRWHYEATHSGPTPSRRIQPTGKNVIVTVCTVAHVKGDKIVDEWTYSDQSALMEQLGALPPT